MAAPDLFDSHAHIHHAPLASEMEAVVARSRAAGVSGMLVVGCDTEDSAKAIQAADMFEGTWVGVGFHPHEAHRGPAAWQGLASLASAPKVRAVGECGLDYYRNLSEKADQEAAFRFQIELALDHHLPMVWHIREAFDDFFRIIDEYPGVRGVVHSFTDHRANMEKAVERGFTIALNGIMTFTKDAGQLEAARHIPLEKLILETDSPYLAPVPLRGKPNEPAYIAHTAAFLSKLRQESIEDLATQTTRNSRLLFGLDD